MNNLLVKASVKASVHQMSSFRIANPTFFFIKIYLPMHLLFCIGSTLLKICIVVTKIGSNLDQQSRTQCGKEGPSVEPVVVVGIGPTDQYGCNASP